MAVRVAIPTPLYVHSFIWLFQMLASIGKAARSRGTIPETHHLPHPALLSRAWPTEDPWTPQGVIIQGRGGGCLCPPGNRRVLHSLNGASRTLDSSWWGNLPKWPQNINTYCPVLAKICPWQVIFSLLTEAGSLSKRKPHEKNVNGLVHPSTPLLLLPSYIEGQEMHGWLQRSFQITINWLNQIFPLPILKIS